MSVKKSKALFRQSIIRYAPRVGMNLGVVAKIIIEDGFLRKNCV
jgi:hypothetical protein